DHCDLDSFPTRRSSDLCVDADVRMLVLEALDQSLEGRTRGLHQAVPERDGHSTIIPRTGAAAEKSDGGHQNEEISESARHVGHSLACSSPSFVIPLRYRARRSA